MKIPKPALGGIGAAAGLLSALIFYMIVWSGFGYDLAGSPTGFAVFLAYSLPILCGAAVCAFAVETWVDLYIALGKTVLLALGVSVAVFLWMFLIKLAPLFLEGWLLRLNYVSCPFVVMCGPLWFGLKTVITRK